jgi:flagellar basal body P-ring formation protein FlgA
VRTLFQLSTFGGIIAAMCGFLLMAEPVLAEQRPLPVPTLTLYPGDRISADVIVDKVFTVNAANLAAYVIDMRQLEGKYARRTLVAGRPIALSTIKERDAVQRGTAAPAIFQSDGLVITTILMPLESAAAGAMIQARNTESGTIVQALVRADGSLLVGGQ